MATKNIVKFLLKMIVAAAVLAGIVFLVLHFTSSNKSTTEIIDKSYKTNLVQKYQESYDGLINYAPLNSAKYLLLENTNKINSVLIEYYEHYLTLTAFEEKDNSFKKNNILEKINELEKAVEKTTQYLKLTKSSAIPDDERTLRFDNTFLIYLDQTKILFELDDLLQDFVFETNYQSKYSGITYEVQLEMIKDYSKYVFDNEIDGKINNQNPGPVLSSTQANGFSNVINKFIDRQKVNKNGDIEVKFVDRYFDISQEYLTEFYTHTYDANLYIESIESETMKYNLDALYNYLCQDSF